MSMHGALAIVGPGRVGRAIGRRLRDLGWPIGAVVARSEGSARRATRFIGAGTPHAVIPRRIVASSMILIATPDRAIRGAAKELARIGGEELRGKVVLHTSGALDSNVLQALRDAGAAVGSMHPLQTFGAVGVPPLDGRLFAIEGDTKAVKVARRIARSLGGIPQTIAARDKPLYHAAGAFAAGHALVIVESAVRLLLSIGLKRREATRALVPMTEQVLKNYVRLGPRAAWTGPLSRGDVEVVSQHRVALRKASREYDGAYDALNRLAAKVFKGGLRNRSAGSNAKLAKKKSTKGKRTGG
jgi:predicted short-subunit dehydrogenase-like oxidoreductase (DUF2520 family)